MVQRVMDAKLLTDIVIQGLTEKKGQDIVRMDLQDVESSITDYFVVCTGTSDRHVQALADAVVEHMKREGERPISQEGLQTAHWVLIDYVNVVVHIFQEETRQFYRLESLWGDAAIEHLDDDR